VILRDRQTLPLHHTPTSHLNSYILQQDSPILKKTTAISSSQLALLFPSWFQAQVVNLVGVLKQSPLRQTDRLAFGHVAFLDEL